MSSELINVLTFVSGDTPDTRHTLEPQLPNNTFIPLDRSRRIGLQLLSYTVPMSFYNVSASLGNNTLKYTNETGDVAVVVLDDGAYSVNTVSRILHRRMYDNGHFTLNDRGEEVYPIDITFETHQPKNMIHVKDDGWSITLEQGIATFLGFEAKSYPKGDHIGEYTSNVNRVKELKLVCDKVETSDHVIWSFGPNFAAGFGSYVIENLSNSPVLELPRRLNEIDSKFTIVIQDQNKEPIEFFAGEARVRVNLFYRES